MDLTHGMTIEAHPEFSIVTIGNTLEHFIVLLYLRENGLRPATWGELCKFMEYLDNCVPQNSPIFALGKPFGNASAEDMALAMYACQPMVRYLYEDKDRFVKGSKFMVFPI